LEESAIKQANIMRGMKSARPLPTMHRPKSIMHRPKKARRRANTLLIANTNMLGSMDVDQHQADRPYAALYVLNLCLNL
jgi:hypothetical protein